METVIITVAGHANVGKSTLARLILKVLRENGISSEISQDEIDEGYDVDLFEDALTSIAQKKIEVLVETKQLNRNSFLR